MTLPKTALYRASLLTDNLGIRLCLAAMLVMPSALVFLSPLFSLLDVAGDELLAFGPRHDGSWSSALAGSALFVGFIGAWMRISAQVRAWCAGRAAPLRPRRAVARHPDAGRRARLAGDSAQRRRRRRLVFPARSRRTCSCSPGRSANRARIA
jgi:hypothetical protein